MRDWRNIGWWKNTVEMGKTLGKSKWVVERWG
jgi:hypothetical protein